MLPINKAWLRYLYFAYLQFWGVITPQNCKYAKYTSLNLFIIEVNARYVNIYDKYLTWQIYNFFLIWRFKNRFLENWNGVATRHNVIWISMSMSNRLTTKKLLFLAVLTLLKNQQEVIVILPRFKKIQIMPILTKHW